MFPGMCCWYKATQSRAAGSGAVDWKQSTLRRTGNTYQFLTEDFPAPSEPDRQEGRMLNITPSILRATRGTSETRGNFLRQTSPDASWLKWKGWAVWGTSNSTEKGAQHIQRGRSNTKMQVYPKADMIMEGQ